jgi:type IV pilus assembly protein PilM
LKEYAMAAKPLVGLDIGTGSVRAAECCGCKQDRAITNFARVPLPEGAVQNGVVRDEQAVTAALKKLWSSTRFGSRRVVLGITNPQVVVREMTVANLPTKELAKSLPYQVGDALPIPAERAVLDFHPLEDPGTRDTVRGLLIAAPKDAVMAAVRAAEKARLTVERVDLASFALLRSISWLDEQVEAIVDIGQGATSVIVHLDGEPLIVRTIPRGGGEITETIATRLGLSAAEAENAKVQVGLNDAHRPDVADVVRDAVRPLINEINSSFTYLNTGDRQNRVSRLALSGGGAQLPGLIEALREQLDVQVVMPDPLARARSTRHGRHDSLELHRSGAAVSIGLTMGAAR